MSQNGLRSNPALRAEKGLRPGALVGLSLAGALLLCLGSCAQKGFPPGGPEDRTPPELISSFPDSGAAGVDPGLGVTLLFSEKMNKRSVEGAFHLVPPSDLESLRWEKNSLTLVPAEGLVKERIYTILLAAGMKDARGNKTREPSVIHFSTGDSLPPGRLEGAVITGRLKSQGVMVWAFAPDSCPPSMGTTVPEGAGQADPKGEFFIAALPLDRTYRVYAHYDIDMNGEVDEGDLLVEADTVATITADEPTVEGIEIYLVQEDEPGTIAGTVADSARVAAGLVGTPADTAAASLDLPVDDWGAGTPDADVPSPGSAEGLGEPRPTAPDSAGLPGDLSDVAPDSLAVGADTAAVVFDPAAMRVAQAESVYLAATVIVIALDIGDSANFVQGTVEKGGSFALTKVRPGSYRLEVFRDLDGDRSPTPDVEPFVAVEDMIVRPGRTTELGELVLRWPEAVRIDELRERVREGGAPW
jgi:hypothetical protein